MLNRQKIILEILRLAQRTVTKLELMKWAFLISRESPSRGGSAFYEFLPYHFGPYSFSLQRDLDGFATEKVVEETEKSWKLKDSGVVPGLPARMGEEMRDIVSRFLNMSAKETLEYVYEQYPSYSVNSKIKRLCERRIAPPAVFTAGYEGRQIDGFLDLMIHSGIQRIIDVRNNPIARRYGFHRSTLNRLSGLLAIEYVHIPELGIVSAERQNLASSSDYQQLFDRYEMKTLREQSAVVERVCDLVREKASVLVCMEAKACECHRSRLAKEVSTRTGLAITDLG